MFLNISNPVTILLFLVAIIFLIFLGKVSKVSLIPGVGLLGLLGLLIYYVVCLKNPDLAAQRNVLMNCIFMNLIYIFMLFSSYLWANSEEAIAKNKKSYDDSLAWLWKKV
ncbi:MAG: hypothetical protein FWF46_00925 [Oscillospiraceae bacterium]|nr:hypothetical protein [Oscillospiraceae bacterium]